MFKDFLIAISLSNVYFIPVWHKLLTVSGWYFVKNNHAIDAAAAMFNVLLLSVAFFCCARMIRHTLKVSQLPLLRVLFLFGLLIPLNNVRQLSGFSLSDALVYIGVAKYIILILLIFIIISVLLYKYFSNITHVVVLIIISLAPYAIFTFSKAVLFIVSDETEILADQKCQPLQKKESRSAKRIVWLIFDELDQQLTFDKRPSSVQLPELDRLRKESFYTTSAFPPAGETIKSLPSLISGELIRDAEPDGPGNLILTLEKNGQKTSWSSLPNVFSEAQRLGTSTALIGWHHPYCRVLHNNLNLCSWQSSNAFDVRSRGSFLQKSYLQWRDIVIQLPLLSKIIERFDPLEMEYFVNSYLRILDDARSAVVNPELGLIMVHWTIPHNPFIYNRLSKQFVNDEKMNDDSYLDNLALVDKTLGQLRDDLEKSGLWENTTLIVSSDHWRRQRDFFNPENLDIDYKIPFMIKLSGPPRSYIYSKPINTVVSKNLILELLRGHLASHEDLADWISTNNLVGKAAY